MSKVFQCETCVRRTTEPFIIDGMTLCTICAEKVDPASVSWREKRNYAMENPRANTRYRSSHTNGDW